MNTERNRTAVIICNGTFPKGEYPLFLIRTADYVVCCDGASSAYRRHCMKIFGGFRKPDAIVGDMDSTSRTVMKKYKDIIVHIPEQETNDMTKSFHYLLEHYPDISQVHILAATGKREDHTVGNLSLLMEYAREMKASGMEGIGVDMVSDWSTVFAVTDSCSFEVGEGREISIFSPDNSLKITSEGLMYQTGGVYFDNWWKATLNKATADIVRLTFSHPSIALIILD